MQTTGFQTVSSNFTARGRVQAVAAPRALRLPATVQGGCSVSIIPGMNTMGWCTRLRVLSAAAGAARKGTRRCCGHCSQGPELLSSILEGISTAPLGRWRASFGWAEGKSQCGAWPKVSTVQLLCIIGIQSGGWKIPTNPAQAAQQKWSGNIQTSADPQLEGCPPQRPRSSAGTQPAGTVLWPWGQEQSHSSPLGPTQPPARSAGNWQNSN